MPACASVTVLAPNAVRASPLPKRWHKRGRFRELPELGETQLLANAFGIDHSGLAAAPLHYLGMTGHDPAGFCLFAWPVYLHARREQLILMTGEEFELSEREATEIIDLLGEYFPEWRLERTRDAMWFVITDQHPDIETTPLQSVLGEDINDHLPRGRDAMEWVKVLNELQMILFDSKTNRDREAAGQPPVNSLWLWGGGRLVDIRTPAWRRLVTNDPVALGIGRQAGLETRWLNQAAPEPDEQADIAEPGTLWVYTGAGGAQEGDSPVPRAQWTALGEALRRGDIDSLTLIEPGHGELAIDTAHTRSWLPWR